MRHGPHQDAQKSTSTMPSWVTVCWNDSSVRGRVAITETFPPEHRFDRLSAPTPETLGAFRRGAADEPDHVTGPPGCLRRSRRGRRRPPGSLLDDERRTARDPRTPDERVAARSAVGG